ncbi:MAG: glycosyltransferase family 2 protein [Lachnospiraceae bacterium]
MMISIIVPVYKSEKTLADCLNSLLAQTLHEIEIICVVDGSPDSCGDICDSFAAKDDRVKVIKRRNGGVSSARNRGIEEAGGEYIAFVDSDDTVDPQYCEKLLDAVEKTGADLAVCGFHHWYIGRDVEKKPAIVGTFSANGFEKEFLGLYQTGFLNMPWNKLFKKEKAGAFPSGLSLGEDLLFNMDYLEHCETITVIPDALYHYIQEENGNTLSSKKRDDKLEIASRVCAGVQKYYEKLSGQKMLHPVIAGKFVMEFLDDCEKLPFDRETKRQEKIHAIRALSENAEFLEACAIAEVTAPDYKVLQWCFNHKMWKLVYPICVCRKWVVVVARWIWNR